MSFPRYPEYKDSGVDWIGEAGPVQTQAHRLIYGGWDSEPRESCVLERCDSVGLSKGHEG
jgi:hypothetical protein